MMYLKVIQGHRKWQHSIQCTWVHIGLPSETMWDIKCGISQVFMSISTQQPWKTAANIFTSLLSQLSQIPGVSGKGRQSPHYACPRPPPFPFLSLPPSLPLPYIPLLSIPPRPPKWQEREGLGGRIELPQRCSGQKHGRKTILGTFWAPKSCLVATILVLFFCWAIYPWKQKATVTHGTISLTDSDIMQHR